jgi:hypothetical protein
MSPPENPLSGPLGLIVGYALKESQRFPIQVSQNKGLESLIYGLFW